MMTDPELTVLALNGTVACVAYLLIYPRFCGSDGYKIAFNDIIATGVVLSISGHLYWGSNETFNLVLFSTNWLWFTLLTYVAIEIPFMLWYFKKHDVWSSF